MRVETEVNGEKGEILEIHLHCSWAFVCFVFLDVAHKPLLHLLSSAMLGLSAERSLAAAPRISFTAVRGEKKRFTY